MLRDLQEAIDFDQFLENVFSPERKDLPTPKERLQLHYELQTLSTCYLLMGFLGVG
jgi:hypothetical protein